jgi:hypothetical protein
MLVGGIDWRPDLEYAKGAAGYGIRAQPRFILFLGNRLDVLLVNGYLNPAAAGFYPSRSPRPSGHKQSDAAPRCSSRESPPSRSLDDRHG